MYSAAFIALTLIGCHEDFARQIAVPTGEKDFVVVVQEPATAFEVLDQLWWILKLEFY